MLVTSTKAWDLQRLSLPFVPYISLHSTALPCPALPVPAMLSLHSYLLFCFLRLILLSCVHLYIVLHSSSFTYALHHWFYSKILKSHRTIFSRILWISSEFWCLVPEFFCFFCFLLTFSILRNWDIDINFILLLFRISVATARPILACGGSFELKVQDPPSIRSDVTTVETRIMSSDPHHTASEIGKRLFIRWLILLTAVIFHILFYHVTATSISFKQDIVFIRSGV